MTNKIINNNEEPSSPVHAAGGKHQLHQAIRIQRLPLSQLQLLIAQLHRRGARLPQHLLRHAQLVLSLLSSLANCTGNQ